MYQVRYSLCHYESSELNDNHSIAYCLLGYLCAYYRYYYPSEYITAYLNNAANDDDIANGTSLAMSKGISIKPPRFGHSKADYFYSKEEKTITKGVASVKYLNPSAADTLYNFAENNYKYLSDVLRDVVLSRAANARQIDTLAKIDYFSDFGNVPTVCEIIRWFRFFDEGDMKKMSRKKELPKEVAEIVEKYSVWHNADGKESADYSFTNEQIQSEEKIAKALRAKIKKNPDDEESQRLLTPIEKAVAQHKSEIVMQVVCEIETLVRNQNLPDIPLKTKIANQKEALGYFDITTGKTEDRLKAVVVSVYPIRKKADNKIWAYSLVLKSIGTGVTQRFTVRENAYKETPVHENDIVRIYMPRKDKKGYWNLTYYDLVG